MRRFGRTAAVVLAAVACMACMSGPAWAQYVTPPGQTPHAGSTDTNAGSAHLVNNNTQVLGSQFSRGTASGSGVEDFLASTGADIAGTALLGAGLLALGVVLVRRSRRTTTA